MNSCSHRLVFSLQPLDRVQIFSLMCAAAIPCWTDSGQKEHCILLPSSLGTHCVYTANSIHPLLTCWFFHAAFFPASPSFLKLFLLLIRSVQFSSVSDYTWLHLFSLWPLATSCISSVSLSWLVVGPVKPCRCHCAAAQLALQRLLVIMWILVSPAEKAALCYGWGWTLTK